MNWIFKKLKKGKGKDTFFKMLGLFIEEMSNGGLS